MRKPKCLLSIQVLSEHKNELTKKQKLRNAIQKYLDSYKIVCPSLTDEELNFIAERTTISELKNKTFYLKKDQVQNEMSFLYQGLDSRK